ncbi:MAG: hypothetical protein MI920_01680 [Kiloniellales bacterium]|nr:hypothetical protein [Kiloniellales bacterium]
MADKILAIFSLGGLVAFMGVVVWFINEPDLWIVTLLVLAMAAYDFWITLRAPKNGERSPK